MGMTVGEERPSPRHPPTLNGAASMAVYSLLCPACGTVKHDTRIDAVTCSRPCKEKHRRDRHRAVSALMSKQAAAINADDFIAAKTLAAEIRRLEFSFR